MPSIHRTRRFTLYMRPVSTSATLDPLLSHSAFGKQLSTHEIIVILPYAFLRFVDSSFRHFTFKGQPFTAFAMICIFSVFFRSLLIFQSLFLRHISEDSCLSLSAARFCWFPFVSPCEWAYGMRRELEGLPFTASSGLSSPDKDIPTKQNIMYCLQRGLHCRINSRLDHLMEKCLYIFRSTPLICACLRMTNALSL